MGAVTWTAPDVQRPEGPLTGPERPMLQAFLDWHRATLLYKCSGLTGEQLADAAVANASLDDEFVHNGEAMSLRLIYLHMIEEYARHLGHADLLRELIDGATGELPAGRRERQGRAPGRASSAAARSQTISSASLTSSRRARSGVRADGHDADGQRGRRPHHRGHQVGLVVELPSLRCGQLAQRFDGDGELAA
jgi:Protein of unknown function (DUF664)